MIKPNNPGLIQAIDKASKDHLKAAQALAKAVAAAFPPKARVRVPVGKGHAVGVVVGKPSAEAPLRVTVQIDSYRVFCRAILYTEIELLDDLFPENASKDVSNG